MPCPYFEPQRAAERTEYRNARLPLFLEYGGLCWAGDGAAPAPEAMRFRCCNHGNSRGACERFPSGEKRSSLRYHLARRTEGMLYVLCVEEESYAPARWFPVTYFAAGERLDPEIDDVCIRAQILAFCRGYLSQFPD